MYVSKGLTWTIGYGGIVLAYKDDVIVIVSDVSEIEMGTALREYEAMTEETINYEK